jgi:hypothetical protein
MTRATVVVTATVMSLALAGVASAGTAPPKPGGCGAKPDSHGRWEVVFATERTRPNAEKALKLFRSRGFPRATIEVESCTAYEVSMARYSSSMTVQQALNQVKKAGFKSATREDS